MSLPPKEQSPEELQRGELLPEELRELRLGRPRATLRQDTLRAVRLALDEPALGSWQAARGWHGWRPWRIELGFTAAIALSSCLLSFCLLSPACRLPEALQPLAASRAASTELSGSKPASSSIVPAPSSDSELEVLGPYTSRYRGTAPRRNIERRYDHDDFTDLDRI